MLLEQLVLMYYNVKYYIFLLLLLLKGWKMYVKTSRRNAGPTNLLYS